MLINKFKNRKSLSCSICGEFYDEMYECVYCLETICPYCMEEDEDGDPVCSDCED